MKSISTHVLDITRGRPAQGVPVILEERTGFEAWRVLGGGNTDADGRIKDLVPPGTLAVGTYRIGFDTATYFTAQGVEGFYPEVSIVFAIRDADSHYHVPLLLSPFGYSTYRGS